MSEDVKGGKLDVDSESLAGCAGQNTQVHKSATAKTTARGDCMPGEEQVRNKVIFLKARFAGNAAWMSKH